MDADKDNCHTKETTGICIKSQTKVVIRFAINSFLESDQNLVNIYPLKATSSEKAVAKEITKESKIGSAPKFAPRLKPPYLK
jgi:hypothetical protein